MHILIVNPFSSPGYLSESFKRLGLRATALYNRETAEILTIDEKGWG